MATTDNTQNSIFPRGERNSPDYFTGEAYLHILVNPEQTDGYYSAGSVTFEPGARTNWHTHPSAQTLVVTERKGWYQERGKAAIPAVDAYYKNRYAEFEKWQEVSADSDFEN